MQITKKELEQSIIYFANGYNINGINYLLETNIGLPETIKLIIYKLFINKFDYRSCSEQSYNHYQNILEYVAELDKNGFVTFK